MKKKRNGERREKKEIKEKGRMGIKVRGTETGRNVIK